MTKIRTTISLILRRLAFGLLVMLVIGYLSYFGLEMARGVPFNFALVDAAEKTITYASKLAQGDLGMTAANSLSLRPVSIAETTPVIILRSLGLLLASLLIAAVLGISLGVWGARRRHAAWSLLVLAASIVGVSLPSFFAALLLQMGVIRLTQASGKTWLPVGGFGWDTHLLLPALVLAARPLAQITRVTYVTLTNILAQDYVRTARSKGLSERLVMLRHVFLNAAVPVLTTLGVSLRYSLVSLPVVEFFFSWPGMGFTLLKAIALQDDNLTAILVLALGALFILVNLLLEVSYRLIDPQLRATPEHIAAERGEGLLRPLLAFLSELPRWLKEAAAAWKPSARSKNQRPFSPVHSDQVEVDQSQYEIAARSIRRTWIQGTLKNPSLVFGLLFLLGLAVVILFGPQLAPHSPYTTVGMTYENGQFRIPPFAPDEVYPLGTDVLGRDILSLIIAGAQQTMFLAVLVVLARMFIGFVLGALAGWMKDTWVDRAILGLAEVIAAFPALLFAMLLILALGIRNGMQPFVIGLCFVGWGEIMQFVRSEVMSLQTKLFIESAVAAGLNSLKIVVRHILPNLAPALISVAALEMGAVLMLLGELGFIGIFIGGGAFAELDIFGPPFHYSDVPEWGALLSNVRPYARAYPWTAVYPSLTFFIVILGFNFLGEGIRRMVDIVGVRVVRIFNRYTVTALFIVGAGFLWVRGQTGALAFYQRQAEVFNGSAAMAHVQALADPALEGRAVGSPGLDAAAEYIREQFIALGVQPAGANMTYYQPRSRGFASLDAIPSLQIDDAGPDLVYHQDYVERPYAYTSSGLAQAPVRFLAFGEQQMIGTIVREYASLRGLDFTDEILLVLSDYEASLVRYLPHAGLLVVREDPVDFERRYTLSPVSSLPSMFGPRDDPSIPTFWISPAAAERLLARSGQTLADVRRTAENLQQDEVYNLETGMNASLEIQAAVEEKVTVNHVIGYIPGVKAGGMGDPEAQLDNKMIVVMAQYDSPPLGADGLVYPGANDNASAIGVMLETIRTMKESGYEPYKTFLFVAYSGEGYEGGAPFMPEVSRFLQTKYGFSENFEIEAIIELRGLGSSQGDNLEIVAGGSLRLANLVEEAARRMNVPSARSGNIVDLSIVFEERSSYAGGEEAPTVDLVWEGWESTAQTARDQISMVSVENLEDSGRALSLALMILGREIDY